MANEFFRLAIEGADENTWARYVLAQEKNAKSDYTSYLYDDSGTLKITTGRIGIDDGTNTGVSIIDTVTTISIAAVSNGNWAYVLMSVSGISVTFSAIDIAGETNPDSFPSGLNALWNGARNGYYTGTNRIIGLVWVNSAGTLEGITNVLGNRKGIRGYTQSDDVNDNKYNFTSDTIPDANDITSGRYMYVDDSGTKSAVKVNRKIIEIGDWNMDATASITVAHGLDNTAIISVQVFIRNDSGLPTYELWPLDQNMAANESSGEWALVGTTIVSLSRVAGRGFDNTDFNQTSYNRGWIIIDYLE